MEQELKVMQTVQWDDLDNATGKSRSRMRVKFMVGENGPFYEYFPVEDFNGATARQTLEQRAAQIRMLQP